MGWILRDMKSIPPGRRGKSNWRDAVFVSSCLTWTITLSNFLVSFKTSGLAAVTSTVGDPSYIVTRALAAQADEDGIVDVLRYQHLQDSLTEEKWTAEEILFKAAPFNPSTVGSSIILIIFHFWYSVQFEEDKCISKPAEMRKALLNNPWLIPRAAVPETVFFAHSCEAFLRIYDRWLGPG